MRADSIIPPADFVWPSKDVFLEAAENGLCPFCGRGPFKCLSMHFGKMHLAKESINEHYGLNRGHTFVSDLSSEKWVRAAQRQSPSHRSRMLSGKISAARAGRNQRPRRKEFYERMRERAGERGVPYPPQCTPELLDEIRDRHLAGESFTSIGRSLGHAGWTISRWLRRFAA